MIYPKIPLAQSIIELCRTHQILHIVISPGSRNAPLTIGFTSNPEFTCYSITDERCAAFFALGMAQQLKKPTAVVCTSGSALLNYYPAFAEAFYSQIPLIVISADRPKNKIDIGDGQTIRQENVFANHSLYNANLTEDNPKQNHLAIQEAIYKAKSLKGPVHINAPFEEPLYEKTETLSVHPLNILLKEEYPFIPECNPFVQKWNKSLKKLVLIGSLDPNELQSQFLDILANDPSVVVLTEVHSNLHHPNFVNHIDTLITPFKEKDFLQFQPDILLTLGGMIVSKRIKTFLRNFKPKEHWHIDPLIAYNTFDCLSQHFTCSPNTFFEVFLKQIHPVKSEYQATTLEIVKEREKHTKEYLSTLQFSDLKVYEIILKKLPKDCQLQLSNSSAIRYAQLFAIDPSIEVFCNRGTSGIDGSTSTAIGAAVASNKETILITGDLSFLYDSNALWNQYIPKNFKIIVINNNGGGIFRILPGHEESDNFRTYFETPHGLKMDKLAEMFGFNYFFANNENSLNAGITFLLEAKTPILLEIDTPTELNNSVLTNYFNQLI